MRKAVSGIMLTLLILTGTLTLALNIQPAKAGWTGTVYIRADGSVYPASAPIRQEAFEYIVTDDIYGSIVIEAEVPVHIHGEGHIIQGNGNGVGINITINYMMEILISDLKITNFDTGILVYGSGLSVVDIIACIISGNKVYSNNKGIVVRDSQGITVSGNEIVDNYYGVYLVSSSSTYIHSNNVTDNYYGIYLTDSQMNHICHNSFIHNVWQAYVDSDYFNWWDEGYPFGGNYWSDYTGVDYKSGSGQDEFGSDGIGDAPYFINANNIDRYPLMEPWAVLEMWSPVDIEFEYNLDNNYQTAEGSGFCHVDVALYTTCLVIVGFGELIHGRLPTEISTVVLISTDGLDKELAKQVLDTRYFSYNMWNTHIDFSAIIPNPNFVKPINNGHFELAVLITYNNQQYEFFINTPSLINSHYLPLTTMPAPPEDKPPTCVVKLQKDGVEVDEVDVGEFFDIYVGDSTDDKGIKAVRFSSDDIQDGIPTGEWTKWYDWSVSEDDWNAETKIKKWSFATYGPKEVWVEVKDTGGNINQARANIFSGWTFVLITDLHIGRGYSDYHGEDYYLTKRLEEVVSWINDNAKSKNIKFLVVLGDIANSAKPSELEKAKEILDKLIIPYFPTIGNHDVWSDGEANGDYYFNEIFNDEFFKLQCAKIEAEWKSGRTVEKLRENGDSYLQNYAFTYKGINFVFLDFVTREAIILTSRAKAVPHKSTIKWLNESLYEGKPTILFSHHPMVEMEGDKMLQLVFGDVSQIYIEMLQQYLRKYGIDLETLIEMFIGTFDDISQIDYIVHEAEAKLGVKVLANFAGHVHGWSTTIAELRVPLFFNANVDYKEKGFLTPGGIPVITTEALMVASNEPEPKPIIRIVKVEGEKINYSSIDGEFRALNPYIEEIDVETEGATLEWPQLRVKWRFAIELEAYAFTKRLSEKYPLNYTLYVDNIKVGEKQSESWLKGVEFEFDYKGERDYHFSLVVKGYTPDGREEIVETINQTKHLSPPRNILLGVFSPVDIIVTDPDGLIVSKQQCEIPGATYIEDDFNGDGKLDDIVLIPNRKIGNYLITVIPEPEATPSDTYTIMAWSEAQEEPIILAEQVQISNIPSTPYTIKSTETQIISCVPAMVNVEPDTLNLKSKGKWITAYIELPEGYNIRDIDISSILLNGTIPVDMSAPTAVGDYDNDGTPDLMVKFNRTAVCQLILSKGITVGSVTLSVSGKLANGIGFQGCDTIRVRMPGDINMDGKVDTKDISIICKAFGSFPNHPRWNPIADENEDNKIDIADIALTCRNFGKTYK